MKTIQIVYEGPFPEVTVESPAHGAHKCKRGESVALPEPLAEELLRTEIRQKVVSDGKERDEVIPRETDWRLATIEAKSKKG